MKRDEEERRRCQPRKRNFSVRCHRRGFSILHGGRVLPRGRQRAGLFQRGPKVSSGGNRRNTVVVRLSFFIPSPPPLTARPTFLGIAPLQPSLLSRLLSTFPVFLSTFRWIIPFSFFRSLPPSASPPPLLSDSFARFIFRAFPSFPARCSHAHLRFPPLTFAPFLLPFLLPVFFTTLSPFHHHPPPLFFTTESSRFQREQLFTLTFSQFFARFHTGLRIFFFSFSFFFLMITLRGSRYYYVN